MGRFRAYNAKGGRAVRTDDLVAELQKEAPAGEVFMGWIIVHTAAGRQKVPALLTARRLSGMLRVVVHGPVNETPEAQP